MYMKYCYESSLTQRTLAALAANIDNWFPPVVSYLVPSAHLLYYTGISVCEV